MKTRLLTLLLSICVTALPAAAQHPQETSEDIRRTELFNFDWRFCTGDPSGAEQPAFDDSDWRTLDLPHDFQIEQPWDEAAGRAHGFKAPGTAWYRKHFATDPAWTG
ncbi:MAG: beta-galactosidase, partial [Alistipes sp.]|nr:beta-galactosidase [Alistipes sp.]